MKKITKRQLQKKATLLRHKEQRKIERLEKKNSKEIYKQWAKAIKERDNYTCQVCKTDHRNSDPRAIQAAHILSKENYPELKLDMMNGITLCFACHKNAKISSHLDGFVFVRWLQNNKLEQYNYLIEWLKASEIRA